MEDTTTSLFARLISHQPAVLFTQNKPVTSNRPAVLFSQNKPAPAISHQPTEQALHMHTTLTPYIIMDIFGTLRASTTV
jgi:hypothetical protein